MNNYGIGYLGANQGFGYLTADDATNVTLAVAVTGYDANAPSNSPYSFSPVLDVSVTVTGGSCTNLSVQVDIEANNSVDMESVAGTGDTNPTMTDLDGAGFTLEFTGSSATGGTFSITKTAALAPGTYRARIAAIYKVLG